MALYHSLIKYKQERRILSFDLISDRKAKVRLLNARSLTIYISDYYIVGVAEVVEAVAEPRADYMVYNNWDMIASAALEEARRQNIEIHKFGAFAYRLDELNLVR